MASLGEFVRSQPSRAAALVSPGGSRLSYGDLASLMAEVAASLETFGVGRSRRVGVALGHGVDAVACVLSVVDYATLVPLHPDLRFAEAQVLFADLDLAAVVVSPGASAGVREAARGARVGIIEITATERAGRGTLLLDSKTAVHAPSASVESQELALVLTTSGSTARPKLVPHTPASLVATASNWARFHELGPTDCTVLCLPLFHGFGLTGCIAPTIVSGGAVLCLDALEPALVLDAVEDFGATWLSCVPTMLQGIVRHIEQERQPPVLPRLRFIRTGTAQLTEDTRLRAETLLSCAVLASYGLSETGSVASNPSPPRERRAATVGVAYGADVAIADATGEPCAPLTTGEVIVRGDTVITGYLNAPEQNDHLFWGDWFRTGDQGYLDSDGFLTLVGRTKQMINRGGQSLSPLEIEQAIAAHPAVAEVAVVGLSHPTLGEEVAAAVVWNPGDHPTHAQLRSDLSSALMPQKIPSRWLDVGQLPRSAVGKVQNGVLVERFLASDQTRDEGEALSHVEQRIAAIWEDVLGTAHVRPGDSFVGVGGDSLAALTAAARLGDEFGVEVDAQLTLASGSLRDLAVSVEQAPRAATGQPVGNLLIEASQRPSTELSFAEQALWLEEQLLPGTSRYHEPVLLQLSGDLDVDALARAVDALGARHEILRTLFPTVEGAPQRVVLDAVEMDFGFEDCSSRTPDDIANLIGSEIDRPFDLANAPAWRGRLLRIGPREHTLLTTVHHITSDKRSSMVMQADLGALYRFETGQGSAPEVLAVTPGGYANWQRQTLDRPAMEELGGFWIDRLGGMGPPPALFGAAAETRPADRHASHIRHVAGPQAAAALGRLCADHNATAFVVLQAALKVVLARQSGSTDVSLGTPADVRFASELDGVVGCFINTIVLRTDLSNAPEFAQLVEHEKHRCYSAYAHRQLPFEILVAELRLAGVSTPLFDVLFSLDEPRAEAPFAPGLDCVRVRTPPESAKFDLTVDALLGPGEALDLEATYRTACYTADTVTELLESLAALLRRQP